MKQFLLVCLMTGCCYSELSSQFVNVSLGVPFNQRLDINGASYRAASYPNLDLTGSGFIQGGSGWFGWGFSINPYFLDISNLPAGISEKTKRMFCGVYTGPAFAAGRSKYCKPVINLQIGYMFTHLFPSESVSWGDLGAKASLDLVIIERFTIGVAYRPFDIRIEDRTGANQTTSYILKPSCEIRVGCVW